MRRIFWATLGLGLGAAGGIAAARWAARAKERMAPSSVARRGASAVEGLADRIAEAVEAGREAMVRREAEIRAELGLPTDH